MKVKVAETIINSKIEDSIIKNWKSNQKSFTNEDILDDLTSVNYPNLKVTLRIPWSFRGTKNHISIKSELEFTNVKNRVVLSIHCFILKPIIIFSLLGLLTSFIFLVPFYLFPDLNLLIPLIFGILFSGIYISLFYSTLQRISKRFILELKRKNHN